MPAQLHSKIRDLATVSSRSTIVAVLVAAPHIAAAQVAPSEATPPVEAAAGRQLDQSSTESVVGRAVNDAKVESDEIVVTGTLLRGAAPVGSNLISVGQERLQATGAATSNELLATVPQVSNLFNNVPGARLNVAVNQIQVVRPNLRNLSPETGSSASTLILFDGHRVANVGVNQSQVDPDLIPAAAIERVEVVTDGGSSTYGADAVGGVINFITRKRFDGVKVDARYGFADNYYSLDTSVIVGKDWGTGSLFATYGYQKNDALFGRDRDYIQRIDWVDPNLPLRDITCAPGNVRITGAGAGTYPLPSLNPTSGPNRCDTSDNTTFVPQQHRHGAIVGLHQELADWLTTDIKAFYAQRQSTAFSPFFRSVGITGANPFYRQIPSGTPRGAQTVDLDFAPVVGPNPLTQKSGFEQWGVNAEFQVEVTDNWRVRQLLNYGSSFSDYHIVNPRVLGSNPAGINPYDLMSTPAPITALLNNESQAGKAKDSQLNLRTILDGTLFTLPGGDVNVAVGYEYLFDRFQQRIATDVTIGMLDTLTYLPYNRRVHSAFGEIQIPLFGEENRTGGFHSLILSASARYDHFDDFGGTTNPKIGATWKPVQWLSLRGNYSTSFNAPSVVDQLRSQSPTLLASNFLVVRGSDATSVAFQSLSLQGAASGLRPQTADIYSFGFDIDPPILTGLHASASYYHVNYKGLLGQPPAQNAGLIFSQFNDFVTQNPTFSGAGSAGGPVGNAFLANDPRIAALIAAAANQQVANNFLGAGQPFVYQFLDFRTRNFGRLKVEGVDFAVNYRTRTGFGGIDAGISGNYQLDRKSLPVPGGTVVDLLIASLANTNANPRLQFQASLGADIGQFRAQVTLNHSAGYKVFRNNTNLPQDRVSDFNVVNLFFKYDVRSASTILKDLTFTLNVNNIFDQDPPLWRATTGSTPNGFANGFTLGRLVQLGVSKKF